MGLKRVIRRASILILAGLAIAPVAVPEAASAGSWSPSGSMNTGRHRPAAATLLDGRVLIAGGLDNIGPTTTATAELYNPALSLFTPTANNMSQPRRGFVAVTLLDGRVLIAGGAASAADSQTANVEIFTPGTGLFSDPAIADLATVREGAVGARLPNGNILVAGGKTTDAGAPVATAEVYNPVANSWSATGSMITARHLAQAAPLPDGRILVVGGSNGASILSTAEVYDPVSGTFSNAGIGGMGVGRASFAIGTLPGGRVLVAGGIVPGLVLTAAAEIFDPATNTFSSAGVGSLAQPREPIGASLLDGRVLAAGGAVGATPTTITEAYSEPGAAPPPAAGPTGRRAAALKKCKKKKSKKARKKCKKRALKLPV